MSIQAVAVQRGAFVAIRRFRCDQVFRRTSTGMPEKGVTINDALVHEPEEVAEA